MGWADAAVGAEQDAQAATPAAQPQTPGDTPNAGATPPAGPPAAAAGPQASTSVPDGVSFPATNPPAAEAPVVTSTKPGGIMGLVNSLRDALTGKTTPEIGTDENGNQYVKQTTPSGGAKWARIAAQVAVGAARGFAAGKGGNPGAAVAAGVDAGAKFAQDRQQQQQDMSQQARQQNLDRANNQLLTQRIAEQAMAMHRMDVQGTQEAIDFSEKQQDWMAQHAEGGQPVAYVKNLQDLAKAMIKTPGFNENHIQNGLMQPVQLYDKDGKADGFAVYQMKAGANEDMLPAGQTVYHYDGVNDKLVPQQTSQPMKAVDVFATNNAAIAAQNGSQLKAEELKKAKNANDPNSPENKLKKAQAGEANARAGEANANAKKVQIDTAANGSDPSLTHQTIVNGMLDGSVDITKAVGILKDPHAREQYIAEAKQRDPSWTMQKYQSMMKLRDDLTSGKLGDQVQSFNTFLGHASGVDADVNTLRNSSSPLMNRPINWLRTNATNNPVVAGMLPEIDATRNEFQNFIANHALQKSEIDRGEKLLSEDQSPAAMQAAIKDFMKVALTKLGSIQNRTTQTFGDRTPDLISPQNVQAIRSLGLDKYAANYGLMPHTPAAAPGGPPPIASGTPAPPAGYKRVWAPGSPVWKDIPEAQVPKNVPGLVVQ